MRWLSATVPIVFAACSGSAIVAPDMAFDASVADLAADLAIQCGIEAPLQGAPCSLCPQADSDFSKFVSQPCDPGNTCAPQGEGYVCVCVATGTWSCCYIGVAQCACTIDGCLRLVEDQGLAND